METPSYRCHETPYSTWNRDSIALGVPIQRGAHRASPPFSKGADVFWRPDCHPGARTKGRSRRIR